MIYFSCPELSFAVHFDAHWLIKIIRIENFNNIRSWLKFAYDESPIWFEKSFHFTWNENLIIYGAQRIDTKNLFTSVNNHLGILLPIINISDFGWIDLSRNFLFWNVNSREFRITFTYFAFDLIPSWWVFLDISVYHLWWSDPNKEQYE